VNIFDRVVNAVDPISGAKRAAARQTQRYLNTGYSEGAASFSKKAMKGFTGVSTSPMFDIEANHRTLVNRSRLLYQTVPIATSAIKTVRTNVIGSGLRLKARVDYEYLGLTEEEAEKWESQVEREFDFWASSKMADALRLNTFYEMQGLAILGLLMNGDGIAIRKYEDPTHWFPYGLRIQLIEADRLCTPNAIATPVGNSIMPIWGKNPDNGNDIYSGIEINKSGAVVAYHICNQYPYSMTAYTYVAPQWTRIDMYGSETGLPNVLHIFEAERAEQRRGVPILAPVIEQLKQLNRYTDAELMAAVISSMFTVFIKTNGATTEIPLGEGIDDADKIADKGAYEYELGNGAIVPLGPNEEIQLADPKRPNTAFDGFINAMSKSIGAALEIPTEMLLKSFTSSYSASRAALLEAWKMFRMKREWMANELCQPVYEMFLTECVASGRIKAKGFLNDPMIRRAWCRADWNGAAQGMLDPTKEVKAAAERVAEGFSTRDEETRGLTGGSFKENVRQLTHENEMLAAAKKSIEPVKAPPGAADVPPKAPEEDESEVETDAETE